MLINPRVSLLFLVVGSFMGLWSQDQQPSVETVIAEARALKQASMMASSADAYEPSRSETATTVATSKFQRISTMVCSEVNSLDVDPTIPSGIYRAANHRGESKLVRILQTPDNRLSEKRDFYTIDIENKRWYLIRLTKAAIAAIEEKTSHQ